MKYITRYVADSYFQGLSCIPSEEPCKAGQIEFDFVSLNDEDPSPLKTLKDSYTTRPFDLAIPITSVGHHALKELNASLDEPRFLIMGRLNRLLSVVQAELEPDYRPPSLRTRFDFSSVPVQQTLDAAYALSQLFECTRPLYLYEDREAYELTASFLERDLALYGVCQASMGLKTNNQDRFPEVLQAIKNGRHDCVYTQFLGDSLLTILTDYTSASEVQKVTWFMETDVYTDPDPNVLPIQTIIREELAEHVVFYEQLNSPNPLFAAIYARQFLPDYREFLASQNCLQEPLDCDALACQAPPSEAVREACDILECEMNPSALNLPSCFDLMCQLNSPPRYCEALECTMSRAQTCDHHTIQELNGLSADIAVHMDLATTAHMLGYIESTLDHTQRPLPLTGLRDLLLDFYDPNQEVKTCGYPDIEGCKTLIQQGQKINYSGLHSSGPFLDDARLTPRAPLPTVYYTLDDTRKLTTLIELSSQDDIIQPLLEAPLTCP